MIHQKLSLPHLAYLRALAQGLPAVDAARQYLGLNHGHEFAPLHRWVIDLARAVARRSGFSAWRLLGVQIDAARAPQAALPSLDEWADNQGLFDWSEAELLRMYATAFADAATEPAATRKAARAARLQERSLAMLRQLEATAAVAASPGDPLDAWLSGALVGHLMRAGITTLGSLQDKVNTGGQWWRAVAAIGPTKAARLAAAVTSLLPHTGALVLPQPWQVPALASGANRAPNRPGALQVFGDHEDAQAMEAWVRARARSRLTQTIYRREAMRFMLFCASERRVALSGVGVEASARMGGGFCFYGIRAGDQGKG